MILFQEKKKREEINEMTPGREYTEKSFGMKMYFFDK